jgi:hypothetical protein
MARNPLPTTETPKMSRSGKFGAGREKVDGARVVCPQGCVIACRRSVFRPPTDAFDRNPTVESTSLVNVVRGHAESVHS